MSALSAFGTQKLGWANQNKLRIAALSVASALLFSVIAPVALVAAENNGASTNQNASVTAGEVSQTLQNVPGVLSASDQVATNSDADSAATSKVNGSIVDIPKDPEQGVTFGAETGPKLDIELPNAAQAGEAKKVAPGVVAYDSGNGSANAVQPTEDGGVRMLTIIDNPSAPTAYEYKVDVPLGGSIQLGPDGGALIVDGQGQVLSLVESPWAKDAKGRRINTWFTTDGRALTQHVQHNVPGVVYPVTADPWWSPLGWLFSGFKRLAPGIKVVGKKIGPWAWVICAAGGGWAWYRSDASGWVRVGDAVTGCIL